MIGGMGSAGFLALHDGGFANGAITGLALNFTQLNGEYYNTTKLVQQPESFVSNASFYRMLNEAGVTHIQLGCHITSAAVTGSSVSKIASIAVHCEPDPVTATVFIDASYDGDVMVAAGNIPYTAGRESISHYNESLAGARAPGWVGVGGPKTINALDASGKLLKYVQNISTLASPGEADDALMAFEHRLCVAGKPNMIPWPKPDGYDPDDFAIMQRCVDANFKGVMTSMPPSRMRDSGASGKVKYCKCCGISVCSADQPNLNKGWASATWEERQKIIADHTYFEMGSYYYLANDPRVPAAVRTRFSTYGLCADEFEAFDHIPPQLYVRISNRMVGDYVMTQNNIANPHFKNDSIAVGDWSLDEHMTGKYGVPVPGQPGKFTVALEGNFWPSVSKKTGNTYDVPYKIMTPKRGVGANLLVPVALSASAVAYSSTRIESMFMAVGSAAGVAAQQLVDGSVTTVQDVDVTKVQTLLSQRFAQQIHVSAPPGPAPKSYTVKGAGSADWNGQYNLVEGSSKYGRIFYASTVDAKHQIYYSGATSHAAAGWRLAVSGLEVFYLGGTNVDTIPPLTGWKISGGAAPAPTLVAGPV
jgi:hypothetical protein